MKILFFFISVFLSFGYTQSDKLIYLPEGEDFIYPQLSTYAGIHSKKKVTFDVIDLKVKNIKIEPEDSLFNAIDEATKQNLNKLIFVNDTLHYSIIIEYIVSKKISNDYIEFTRPGYIKAVFKQPDTTTREYITYSISCDESNSTVTKSWWVDTFKPVNKKSDILVELIFSDDSLNVKILKNNIPELEQEILEVARNTDKSIMLCTAFTPTRFLLKLKVVRWFGKGNYSKIY